MHFETAASIDFVLLTAMSLYFLVSVLKWFRRK